MMKNVEIPKWLERLPLAPEFRPTDTEFADPIAYISKIEKEASAFGICKVIPPVPRPSKKYVLHNLNKSLSKCPELGSDVNLVTTDSNVTHNSDRAVNSGESRAVFTTRHQELGCEKGKKLKGAVGDQIVGDQKQVWQSGEVYTLEQFEAKSKNFAKSQLGTVKDVNPLVIEALFWKQTSEKPIYVEYANDVPGSGFSEPEGLLRYFDRRRRRRRKGNSFDRNLVKNPDSKNDEIDVVNSISGNKDSGSKKNNPSFCSETASIPSSSGRNDEIEGTAGWKLSNSPWNLQVIARSQGSLTRFMPDDIPGVTSPMVYIGMLFSWFAWHVEDHELHSLNFLHMGSPKTWYSVPGDYAVNFEEAIRLRAYGGDSDRLVALSLLGEKTTVLSPEIIVASGIPCCRLVQNPGEFVVTFPRAYHIGFSHGFNCGEAANFGTPKWLTIAKEAAVRRAAMNYLPMLSHQQLLYLLTMSFISRIPRSLLPGVRSSRLRDRQKEERELLVKRAFIEDILHENRLLTVLLQKNSSYRTVLWDVESMPSSSKESELNKDTDAPSLTTLTGKDSQLNDDSLHDVSQLSDYIGAVGLDLNDDDLPYDFQIESGTLPCVACGILGFPFMAVLQPSASINLHVVEGSAEDAADKAKSNKKVIHNVNKSSVAETSCSADCTIDKSPVPDHSSYLKDRAVSSKVEISKGWNISNVSLKPQIFCLEHAIEIEKLLSSKGGANVLVICHSDFQKIKSHAAAIAEEIAVPFYYTEIPLNNAFLEDLNLIDIAIERDEQVDRVEDWTSQLSINLQHCVKVKKSYPSKNVRHLLSLDALFCDAIPIEDTPSVKWLSRKLRSKCRLKYPMQSKSSGGNETVEDKRKKELLTAKKDVKIIQYSRKRYKYKARACDTRPEDPDKQDKNITGSILDTHREDPDSGTSMIENGDVQTGICGVDDKIGNSCHESVAHEVEIADESAEKNEMYYSETVFSTSDENGMDSTVENEILRNDEKMNESVIGSETCDEDDSRKSCFSNSSGDNDPPSRCDEQMESISNQLIVDSEISKSLSSEEQHNDNSKNILDDPTTVAQSESTSKKTGNKRKREVDLLSAEQLFFGDFIKSPCEGLRPRARPNTSRFINDDKNPVEDKPTLKRSKKAKNDPVSSKNIKQNQTGHYFKCELEGCTMTFQTKAELTLHKGNRCPVQGCRKKFNSHKYAVQHRRVHNDDRPLKCPWDGCKMTFKWAWARTEHIRVHTGERPYACKVEGCGLTFRFVSDFSRHRRKTGHGVGPPA